MKIGLFAAQLVLPAVPGLYVILFRPGVSLLTPRMLIPSMLCINLLALLLGWRRLGWSRNERLDAAMLLVMFALFPWLEYRVLPVGAFEGNLWAQVGCYCAGQAIGYVSVVLAPDWLGRLRQRRYEERVLSGREKFRSRKEVLEQRAEAQEAQRRAKELRRANCLSVCLSAGSLVCKLVSPSVRCSARREGGIAACCRFTGSAGC